ncbi:hypothetical protein [Streptomyces griseorubiginosus]|uniref:hypothetical protein n=1 Tax=Streptomyces griseorubiginosus TaxID=67304 RepID=UPI0036546455
MDPVSVALLAAWAGGLGGEAGRQAWEGLVALVRSPFRRRGAQSDTEEAPPVSSGEAELLALAQTPDDSTRAHALSTALAVRAALDADFRSALEDWWAQARRTTDTGVNNHIDGGTFHAPVIQARDISGGSFQGSPPTPWPGNAKDPT